MTIVDPLAAQRTAELRARADRARRAANELRTSPALDLHRRSLTEVWQGPVAQRCVDDLIVARRQLLAASDTLVAIATRLDRLAEQAELPLINVR